VPRAQLECELLGVRPAFRPRGADRVQPIFGVLPKLPGSDYVAADAPGQQRGEIHFPSFLSMVEHALTAGGSDPRTSGRPLRFLDLGSGLGRAVVAFALCFSPRVGEVKQDLDDADAKDPGAEEVVAVGVEIREKAHQVVSDVVLPSLPASIRRQVSFLCADMFDISFSEADLLLVNATGLEDDVFSRLVDKLVGETRTGARFICLSLPLRGKSCFQELPGSGRQYRMSWGNCTVFFYVKR